MLSAISGGERTKDTIDHLTNPVCDKFAPRRSTNWGPEPLMPAFCGTGRIFSFHKLLFMHLDCRVLAASGCPCLSCWRNMAKLRYGLTYIFLDNDLHFLENPSRLPGRRRNSPLTLRAGMHGGAVMRIGPTFTAVVAITLVAAADVHSDGSGLAEQARRSAQPRQLAQAPEPPPPTAPPGAHSPPSTAPAPPAAAPPNPSPGTPAIV